MKRFVVEFDHRSDGGPTLVGPFDSRDSADEWVGGLPNPLTASWCVVPLSEPEREQ